MALLKDILTRFRFSSENGKLKATTAATKAAEIRLRAATRSANQFSSGLRGIAGAATGLIAVGLARLGVQGLITDFADAADVAAKSSAAMGISTEAYQRLKHAAELSGTSIEALQTGMGKLGKKARDASMGVKKSQEAFEELGVSVENADGSLRNQDEILLDVADKFAAMPDGASKTALAMEIMGKKGADMIPMLNAGADGIKAMGDEAEALGIVLDREALANAEKFNDEMLRMKGVATGLRNRIALKVIPTISRVAERFNEWAKRGDNSKRMLEILTKVSKAAGAALAGLMIKKTLFAFGKGVEAIVGMTKAIRLMGRAAITTQAKIAAIPLALALIGLLIEDLIGFTEGKDSLFGRMLDDAGIDPEPIRESFQEIGDGITDAFDKIWPSIEKLGAAIVDIGDAILDALGADSWSVVVGASIAGLAEVLIAVGEFTVDFVDAMAWAITEVDENWDWLWKAMVVSMALPTAVFLALPIAIAAAFEWLVDELDISWDNISRGWDQVARGWDQALDGLRAAGRAVGIDVDKYLIDPIIVGAEAIAAAWDATGGAVVGWLGDIASEAWDAVAALLGLEDTQLGIASDTSIEARQEQADALGAETTALFSAANRESAGTARDVDFITRITQGAESVNRIIDPGRAQLPELIGNVVSSSRSNSATTINSNPIISVDLTVDGSLDMTGADFENRIQEGAQFALSKVIEEAYLDVLETQGAPP